MLSKKEIFIKVRDHLLKQKAKAIINSKQYPFYDETFCVYKAPNGMTCAIGCLIEPDQYDPEIEGMSVFDAPVMAALEASNIDISDESVMLLLESLQEVHDNHGVDYWEEHLQSIGRNL